MAARKFPIVLAGAVVASAAALFWLRNPGDSASGGDVPSAEPGARDADPTRPRAPAESRLGPTIRENAGASLSAGPGPDGLPPEVRAAARGEPDGAEVREGSGLPPLEIATARPDAGVGAATPAPPIAGSDGPAGAPAPDARSDEARGVSRVERERRTLWTERQRRRNELRVEILTAELRLSAEASHRLAEVLETAVVDRTGLYESLDPARLDEAALQAGLDQIRADEARGLLEALGPAGLETYRRMEAEGRFVLRDEVKRPK